MEIKTFIFLDSETTGLPAFEYNTTRITELCLISVQVEHISLGVLPRVQNKLSLCFNPCKRIHPQAEYVTGLYNDLLDKESSFNEVSYNILINFMERLSKPICFIAHNGIRFDFPILRNHIDNIGKTLPDDILCADSLLAFRALLKEKSKPVEPKIVQQTNAVSSNSSIGVSDEWDALLCDEVLKLEESLCQTPKKLNIENYQRFNETTPPTKKLAMYPAAPKRRTQQKNENLSNTRNAQRKLDFSNIKPKKTSFKLSALYERLTQKVPENAHHAEVDVKMMMECAVHLGEHFVDWVKNNAVSFNTIAKMDPRNICGTSNKIQ